MKITTRRDQADEYRRTLLVDGVPRFVIERAPVPSNAHFNIWVIVGRQHNYPTLRDLKADVPRILAAPCTCGLDVFRVQVGNDPRMGHGRDCPKAGVR